jgi:hypothetical protein
MNKILQKFSILLKEDTILNVEKKRFTYKQNERLYNTEGHFGFSGIF